MHASFELRLNQVPLTANGVRRYGILYGVRPIRSPGLYGLSSAAGIDCSPRGNPDRSIRATVMVLHHAH